MSEPFVAEIRMFSFNFAPRKWALANGQLLPINQNQALFSLCGTTYGGNGTTNFALPNLQSRTPIHVGNGFALGQTGGEENHILQISAMPAHTHGVAATTASAPATAISPDGALPASASHQPYRSGSVSTVAMKPGLVGNAGGAQSHSNIQPYAVANFCIALQGIFPSRN
jgi:microcystin-dependent protein